MNSEEMHSIIIVRERERERERERQRQRQRDGHKLSTDVLTRVNRGPRDGNPQGRGGQE